MAIRHRGPPSKLGYPAKPQPSCTLPTFASRRHSNDASLVKVSPPLTAILPSPKRLRPGSTHSHPSCTSDTTLTTNIERVDQLDKSFAIECWEKTNLKIGCRGRGVTIAVIDDGVDGSHASFHSCLKESISFADPLKMGFDLYGLSDMRVAAYCFYHIRTQSNKEPYYRVMSSTVNALLQFERYPKYAVSMVESYAYYYSTRLQQDFMTMTRQFRQGNENPMINMHALFIAYGLECITKSNSTGYVYFRRLPPKCEVLPFHRHGTHVASICCGNDIGTGTIGIAPNATMYDLRVGSDVMFDGQLEYIDDALSYCAQVLHPDVINMSLGAPSEDTTYTAQIERLLEQGTIVCAATGNSQMQENQTNSLTAHTICYPARLKGIISVGACMPHHDLASQYCLAPFSEIGWYIDFVAPGVDILGAEALSQTSFVRKSGTSMACPAVAGVIALLLSTFPDIPKNKDRVRKVVYALAKCTAAVHVNGKPLEGFNAYTGYGKVSLPQDCQTFWTIASECPEDFEVF